MTLEAARLASRKILPYKSPDRLSIPHSRLAVICSCFGGKGCEAIKALNLALLCSLHFIECRAGRC